MPLKHNPQNIDLQVAWPIVLAGATLGAVLAWGVLSGDQQGRVNLLYLLLVYLFFPLASLVVSTLSLISGRGFNLARLVAGLPVWSNQKRMLLRKARQLQVEKFWLFFQSQLAALAFSLTSLLVFFILLLATDINFVWRSTLLSASDLQPLLKSIATPWLFWPQAQPSIELLQATQDSRMQTVYLQGANHADWWRFILAVQLFYCVFLRSCLLAVTAWLFRANVSKDFEQKLAAKTWPQPNHDQLHQQYQPVASVLPTEIAVNNWAKADLNLLAGFQQLDLSTDNVLNAGPLATEAEQGAAEALQAEQVVLVKSWEPPMGELADFLQNGKGYIWPLDWQGSSLVPLRAEHLQEWQRFADSLAGWQVYMPVGFMPQESP